MSVRRPRPRRAAALGLLATLALTGLAGCTPGGGASAGTAGASVRRAGGRPGAAFPPQAANGPLVPIGPPPIPLAVDLSRRSDPVTVAFARPPRAGLMFDLDTGEVLWRRNPTRVLPMASVTKMMTALLVDTRVAPGTRVRITEQAVQAAGSKVGLLPRGRRVGVQALLYGLLLPSGNDAAVALAQRVSGTTRRFVALMNTTAANMNLRCTRFASPSGLVDRGNHTCAYDLAALARAVLDRPRLARIVARRSAVLPFPIEGGRLYLYNHNPLLKQGYAGTLGIKTGFTAAAGRCLVAAVHRAGRRLGVVLLHSPDIGAQAVKLLDRGFAYERRRP